MDLLGEIYNEYCKIETNPFQCLKPGRYFISAKIYQNLLLGNPKPNEIEEKSLNELVKIKGTIKDIEIINKLLKKQKT